MSSATDNPLSTQVQEARLAAGLSIEGLAFKAGVSYKTVERIEAGESVPRRATLKVIADVLGLEHEASSEARGADGEGVQAA